MPFFDFEDLQYLQPLFFQLLCEKSPLGGDIDSLLFCF